MNRPDRWRMLGLVKPDRDDCPASAQVVDLLAFGLTATPTCDTENDPIHVMLEAIEAELFTLAAGLTSDVWPTHADISRHLARRVRVARLLLEKADLFAPHVPEDFEITRDAAPGGGS